MIVNRDFAPFTVMARKNPIPARELEICRRLRQFRHRCKFSQVVFAHEAGIDSSKLGSLEHERAPVRYDVAWKVCARFNLNPAWWATGQGGPRPGISLPPPEQIGANPRDLFSEVFDGKLKEWAENALREAESRDSSGEHRARVEIGSADAVGRLFAEDWIAASARHWFERVPAAKLNEFLNKVEHFAEDLLDSFPSEPISLVKNRTTRISKARAKHKR